MAGSGKSREVGEVWYKSLAATTSLNDAGYTLSIDGSGNLTKGAAGEAPYAVNYKSTESPHSSGSYQPGVNTGVFAEGWADLKLVSTNSQIIVGDAVGLDGNASGGQIDKVSIGTVDTSTFALEYKKVVGIAEAAKDASAGGTVLTRLRIGGVR